MPHCEEESLDALVHYLHQHPKLEGTPILLVKYYPVSEKQNSAAPATIEERRAAISSALTNYAPNGKTVQDIDGKGVAFVFPDFCTLYKGHNDLSNRNFPGLHKSVLYFVNRVAQEMWHGRLRTLRLD